MLKLKHRIVIYVMLAAGICILAVNYVYSHYNPAAEVEDISSTSPVVLGSKSNTPTKPVAGLPKPTAPQPPKSWLLKVPFTSQAPTANWDALHNEACEEASSIMAYAYFSGMTDSVLKPAFVEGEITKLTDWEQNHFGYNIDINSEEAAQMLETVYGLKTKILTAYTENDLKNELQQNHLVLFPANGIKLGNPNFRAPGPLYHMLVIRGYALDQFISNDPGTRKGMNYPYTFKTLYNANGEFDHQTHTVDVSKKNVIVVWDPKATPTTISSPK